MPNEKSAENTEPLSQAQMRNLVLHRVANSTANMVANLSASIPAEIEGGPLLIAEGAAIGAIIGLHSIVDKEATDKGEMDKALDIIIEAMRLHWGKMQNGESLYSLVSIDPASRALMAVKPAGSA
jgi:hypothetical protein